MGSKPVTKKKPVVKEQKPVVNNTINGSCIIAKIWDDKALQSVDNVSKALLNMTELFKAQNITIEALVKMDGGGTTICRDSLFSHPGTKDAFSTTN
jgi:hypothetical protein